MINLETISKKEIDKSELTLWVRLGQESGYTEFNSIPDFIEYIKDNDLFDFAELTNSSFVTRGQIEVEPVFVKTNYISCYWGGDTAEDIHGLLDSEDIRLFLNEKFEEVILPAYWASALINNDESGLSEQDSHDLHEWIDNNPEYGLCVNCSDEIIIERFDNLLTECLTFTFEKNRVKYLNESEEANSPACY